MGRSREWFNLPKKYNSTGVSTAGKIDSKLNHQKWGDTLLQTDSQDVRLSLNEMMKVWNNNTDAGSEGESLLPDNLGVTESSAIKSCLEDSKTPMDLHS